MVPLSDIHVFTSAAINYLPKVRLLCSSLKKFHPEFKVHFAVADELPEWFDPKNEPFDNVIPISDLGIPNRYSWIFRHSIVELSTGIKPYVLRALLATAGCRAVLYFDPDIVLFSRLDDLLAELNNGSVLLTPHQNKPEKSVEAIIDNEICSLRTGVFNLGFIGVLNDQEGREFTEWWAERLYYFCQAAYEMHLFTDQKWINLAPVFFDRVKILKNSRFNVATWNITTRKVAGSFRDGFSVDDEPLGFYHFSGFDSGAINIMANKYGNDNPAVMSLIRWYDEQTRGEGDEMIQKSPWAFGSFSNGVEITKGHRSLYRLRRDLQEAFPNPFLVPPNDNSYYQWFEWRAAIEHPEIVAPSQSSEPGGFQIPDVPLLYSKRVDWARLRMYLRLAQRDRTQAYRYAYRLWRIFKLEGLRGIKRRLAVRV